MLAIISLAWGNIAALVQRNVKRILAYSSVSHAGFMLIGVAAASPLGARALMYYLIPYAAMSLGAFAVVAARERELGVPVTLRQPRRLRLGAAVPRRLDVGLHARDARLPADRRLLRQVLRLRRRVRHGWWWLIVAGVIATMISAYYYLGIVRAMYFRESAELQLAPGGRRAEPRELLLSAGVLICLVVTVGSFFAVQPLIDVARHAAHALPLA